MKTLDKYIIRTFLTTAVLFFVAMLALRIVGDLFLNLDEFAEVEVQTFGQKLTHVSRYYGYQSLLYFMEMGGIVIVASAAFTLARMNHSNELTAMLAAGVSLHRVTAPIVICAMVMGGLIIIDQEIIIPAVASGLVLDRDEKPGTKEFTVKLLTDGNDSVWYSNNYHVASQVMAAPAILHRDSNYHALALTSGSQANPAKMGSRSGWVISQARLVGMGRLSTGWRHTPDYKRVWSAVGPREILEACRQSTGGHLPLEEIDAAADINMIDASYGMVLRAEKFEPGLPPAGDSDNWSGRLVGPSFEFTSLDGRTLGVFRAARANWKAGRHGDGYWELTEGELFYPSDLTPESLSLRESGNWMDYMSTSDLSKLIETEKISDPDSAELIKHSRFIAPINNLVMLLVGLPFILSRERNIKTSATLCMLAVMVFFTAIFFCRYIGLGPLLSAWAPLLVFGPLSVIMFQSVKT